MKNRKLRLAVRTVILCLIVLAVGYTIYQVVYANDTVDVGDTAPNFVLKDLNGTEFQLKDLRGKGVVLNFWGSWCKPCKAEMPFINEAYHQGAEDVVIVGVDIGEEKFNVQNFVDRYSIDFKIVLDEDRQVTKAYNIDKIPTTYLIDENGVVVDKLIRPMVSPEDVLENMKRVQP